MLLKQKENCKRIKYEIINKVDELLVTSAEYILTGDAVVIFGGKTRTIKHNNN